MYAQKRLHNSTRTYRIGNIFAESISGFLHPYISYSTESINAK